MAPDTSHISTHAHDPRWISIGLAVVGAIVGAIGWVVHVAKRGDRVERGLNRVNTQIDEIKTNSTTYRAEMRDELRTIRTEQADTKAAIARLEGKLENTTS